MKKALILSLVLLLVVSGTVFASSKDDKKEVKIGSDIKYYEKLEKQLYKTKITKEEFRAGLTAKGMTMEEYKELVTKKFEEQAKEKGMTVEEYKKALIEYKTMKNQ